MTSFETCQNTPAKQGRGPWQPKGFICNGTRGPSIGPVLAAFYTDRIVVHVACVDFPKASPPLGHHVFDGQRRDQFVPVRGSDQ